MALPVATWRHVDDTDSTPRLTALVPCVIQLAMKTARPALPKKSRGTVQAEELRACSNKLTESERKKLRDEGMRLFYGCDPKPAGSHRG